MGSHAHGCPDALAVAHANPQGIFTVKLVFIYMYLYYDYFVNFDWCRKVPRAATVWYSTLSYRTV